MSPSQPTALHRQHLVTMSFVLLQNLNSQYFSVSTDNFWISMTYSDQLVSFFLSGTKYHINQIVYQAITKHQTRNCLCNATESSPQYGINCFAFYQYTVCSIPMDFYYISLKKRMCRERLNMSAYLEDKSSHLSSGPHTAGLSLGWSRCQHRGFHTPGTPCWRGMSYLQRQGYVKIWVLCCNQPMCDLNVDTGSKGMLTAELFSPPLFGLPPCVNTLTGVLWDGVAQAEGVGAVITVAQVRYTGLNKWVDGQQVLTAAEGRTGEQLLTNWFLSNKNREML
jgi:hypothetical protein